MSTINVIVSIITFIKTSYIGLYQKHNDLFITKRIFITTRYDISVHQ
jgi:hypothetical protein